MRKNGFIRILIFSLFLVLLLSHRGYAEITISNSWELPTDPFTYTPNIIYRFNATICDDGGYSNIDTVFFEWNNEPNITVIDSFNITENCSVFSITKNDLSANESGWNYKWYANNIANENATPLIDSYTINKANNPVYLYFNNGTEFLNQNVTITYGTQINVTGIVEHGTGNLSRDNVDVYLENNTHVMLSAKTDGYLYTLSTNENQNYSTNSTSHYLIVEKVPTTISLWLDGDQNNKTTCDKHSIINFTSSLDLDNQTIYLDSDYPGWVTQNNTSSIIYNLTNLTTSGGLYYIEAYWYGNENYTEDSNTYYFGVMPYCINNVEFPASGSTYSEGKDYSFEIDCISDIKDVIFEWNGNIYTANNTSNLFYYNLTDLSAGTYHYQWHLTDVNYNTFNSTQHSYVINKIPVDLFWISPTSSPPWIFSTGTTQSVKCQGNESINLTLSVSVSGVPTQYLYGNKTVSDSPISHTEADYFYSCYPTNTNYSGSLSGTLFFQSTSTGGTGSTGGGTAIVGKFLIRDLTSRLSVEAGKSKSTTFKLSNTLSNNLVDVNISVSGISLTWYKLSKTSISNLKRNVPESITITFDIPEDAKVKDYDVTVIAEGKPLVGSTRKATATMKLNVTAPEPVPTSEEPENVTIETTAQENITANETIAGPTGLAAAFEYLKNNVVIVITIAACLLIFLLRNNITTVFMKAGGRKVPKKTKQKTKAAKPSRFKLPSLGKYKLAIRLKRGRGRKTKALEEPKEVKRPEVLEREIKRDIKELQQVLEAEKKMEKKKKRSNLENN